MKRRGKRQPRRTPYRDRAIALLLTVSLAACGGEAATVDAPNPKTATTTTVAAPPPVKADPVMATTTVVFLGDSLTAGYGLSSGEALPEQVSERLEGLPIAVTVINAGVSGDTTANGLARFDWSVKSQNPDYVVIALGGNDFLQGISPSTAKANLAKIIEAAQANGIKPILAGLRARAQAGGRGVEYANIYADLAQTYGVPLYPDVLQGVEDRRLLQSDGLHPTAEGVDRMADNMAAFLKPIVTP